MKLPPDQALLTPEEIEWLRIERTRKYIIAGAALVIIGLGIAVFYAVNWSRHNYEFAINYSYYLGEHVFNALTANSAAGLFLVDDPDLGQWSSLVTLIIVFNFLILTIFLDRCRSRVHSEYSVRQPLRLRTVGRCLEGLGFFLVFGTLLVPSLESPFQFYGEPQQNRSISVDQYVSQILLSREVTVGRHVKIFRCDAQVSADNSIRLRLPGTLIEPMWYSPFLDPYQGLHLRLSRRPGMPCWADSLPRIWLVMMLFGAVCIWLGKRLSTTNADDILSSDSRKPILYLRSFPDDDWFRRKKFVANPMQKSAEEQLAFIFNQVGPFVCFGKPGERIPKLGAFRKYVGDDWQKVLISMLSEVKFVILEIGDTESLYWEFESVVAHVDPERILVYLPHNRWNMRWRKRYTRFRQAMASRVSCLKFPAKISSTRFWMFDQEWNLIQLPNKATAVEILMGTGERKKIRTLKPFFDRAGIELQMASYWGE